MVRWMVAVSWLSGCGQPPPGPPTAPAPASGPVCGDGIVEGEEGCDQGVSNADDGYCTTQCQPAECGDGLVRLGVEGCDAGAANADDGACTSACQQASCGDGLLWVGVEGCDEGAANADDGACTAGCALATCGDGLLWAGVEGCDDANPFGGDGCSPVCRPPEVRTLSGDATAQLHGAQGSYAGISVSSAGDVNGDGLDDVIVGAYGFNTFWGAAHIVYGTPSGELELARADATLIGADEWESAGVSVSGAGDVNGDGFDDVIVGTDLYFSWGDEPTPGRAYVVYGPIAGTMSLADADATLIGVQPEDGAGYSVAAADLNGDGLSDLIVGAPDHGSGSGAGVGVVYVVYGPVEGVVSLADADARLVGEAAYDYAGYSVSGAGDVNGDGVDDLLVGAYGNDGAGRSTGATYVVYGPVVGDRPLSTADAKLSGLAGDSAGFSVSGAGDVNGDGFDDVLIGAPYGDSSGSGISEGAAYVVYGPVSGSLSLANADARLVGWESFGYLGYSVSGVGDVNGDGFDDVIAGAPGVAVDAGATYLLHGPLQGTILVEGADVSWIGETGGSWGESDSSGWSVSGAGDVDGDGLADLLIGAPNHDGAGANDGVARLVLSPDRE